MKKKEELTLVRMLWYCLSFPHFISESLKTYSKDIPDAKRLSPSIPELAEVTRLMSVNICRDQSSFDDLS